MKWTWGKQDTTPIARSDLPCPMIIRDGLPDLKHMANGKIYDSKRAFSQATKDAGCVEIGNEMPKQTDNSVPPVTKAEVAEAYKKVRDGYKPSPIMMRGVPKESGWN